MGDFGDRNHAAAHDRHSPPVFLRQVEHKLHAVNGRAEASHHHALFGAAEDFFHARAYGALAFGVAGAVGIGRIRQQQKHAALAVFGQGMQVEQLVIGGRGVHLEVARVEDHPQGGGDGQSHGAHDGMGDVDEFDLERPDLDDILGLDGDHARLAGELVLLHAAVHQSQGEIGPVDGHVDFAQKIGHGADVVFVAVGEDQRQNVLLMLLEKGKVGHYQVDAQQLGFGEHHAAIDDEDVVAVAKSGHIHAEFAQPAERNHLQFAICHY